MEEERVHYLEQMGFESGFEHRKRIDIRDVWCEWVSELGSGWCPAFLRQISGKLKQDVVPDLSGNTDSFRVSTSINGVIAVFRQRCCHVEAFISSRLSMLGSAQIRIVSTFRMAATVALAAPFLGRAFIYRLCPRSDVSLDPCWWEPNSLSRFHHNWRVYGFELWFHFDSIEKINSHCSDAAGGKTCGPSAWGTRCDTAEG